MKKRQWLGHSSRRTMAETPRRSMEEIREILSGSPSPDMIESLEHDPRKGVASLLRGWRRAAERDRRTAARAAELYRPLMGALQRGYRFIGGIDEAGRGPLAGPVVAACVVLPPEPLLAVDDSKVLTPAQREGLYGEILTHALGWGLGMVSAHEIDELNIYRATRRAMVLAFEACRPQAPDFLYVDAMKLPEVSVIQSSLIHGDSLCAPISAASILAKVTRDRIMMEEAEKYPQFGFDRHKGYGAPEHLAALERHGPCPIHRMSFAPVKDYVLPSFAHFETLIKRSTSDFALREVGERIKRFAADLTPDEVERLRELYRARRGEVRPPTGEDDL